ncbi:MAG: hypothetical protein BM563_01335 [Bacteroidetes bacterium MedPE-SWsnd-G1]|nr:MAG: hypothetical protein BM563_01335 [Bacteroidetes bacterium MedPE-SWsnd-G1]
MRKIGFILFISFFFFNCSDKDDSLTPEPVVPQIKFVNTYGGSLNDVANDVINTNDGGYIVAGFTQSNDGDISAKTGTDFDFWLLKFNNSDELKWSKSFGGSATEKAFKIIQTSDNGFAIAGYTDSHDGDVSENNGLSDIWILKLDAIGNILWEKSHGFSGIDQALSIIESSDNGFIVSGVIDVSASGGNGNDKYANKKHAGGDYWAIKLDSNGNKEWRRYFGGSFTDTAFDAIETNDNGFIIIGSSDSNDVDISDNKGEYDFWAVKIDVNGILKWEKSYGGTQIDEAKSIAKSKEGDILILGDSRSNDQDISKPKGAADVWLVKISENGDLLWEKSYGGSSFDVGRHISPAQDGGFLLAGSSRSRDGDLILNQGQNDAWILKIDESGNLEWQKSIGGDEIDFAYGISQLQDGSIIAVGETSSNSGDIVENKGFSDVLIIKINVE